MEVNNIKNLDRTWELVNWCEFDKYATKSYCSIHNETEDKNLGDILEVNETKLADFNWICGGSPCQSFSVAGKQEGAKWICKNCGHEYNPLKVHWNQRKKCPNCHSKNIDKKTTSSLIVEYLRVIQEKRPNIILFENVKNLVGKKFKETFDLFTVELEEYGYNLYWKVLNAKNYGIPQNRERVYVIGIKKELDNKKFQFPKPFDNGIRLKDVLETEVDKKFYVTNDKVERFLISLKNKNTLIQDINSIDKSYNNPKLIQFANCITAREDRGISNRKSEGTAVLENKVKQIGNIVNTGNWNNPQRGRIYSPNGCSPSLNCCGGGGLEPKILQTHNQWKQEMYKKYIDDSNNIISGVYTNQSKAFGYRPPMKNLSKTLKANANDAGVVKNSRVRKLTPKECFRLMGFEDKDFNKAKKVVSNSQLYKQAGNSIVVDVLFYILIELYKVMPYLFDDIKLGSFFSGIGAFEKALDRLFECINSEKIENFIQPQENQ